MSTPIAIGKQDFQSHTVSLFTDVVLHTVEVIIFTNFLV